MARIRTIKPEMWTDPEFVECSPNARLLFVAGLNFATDYGVLLDKPAQLKMQCFPGSNVDVTQLVDELVAANLWMRTVAPNGDKVLVIRTFTQHQRVDKPTKGRWGNPADWTEFGEDSATPPGALDDRSLRKGREGKVIAQLTHAHHAVTHAAHAQPAQPPAPAAPPPNDRFDEFWAAYPRHTDRKRALAAWRRLSVTDRAAALDALPTQRSAWRDPKFIPHPTTWLNGRRWEDEITPAGDNRSTPTRDVGGVRLSGTAALA